LLPDHAATTGALEELSTLAGTDVAAGSRLAVVDRLHALRGDAGTLGRLPDLHRLRSSLDAAGLAELVEDLATWSPDAEGALDTFEFCLMASIVDDIRLSDRRVGGFDGHQHSSTVQDFQRADRRHITTTAQRVRRLAAERAHRVGDEQPDEAALVKKEAAKKSRHLPVRETFNATPEVMTSIKPCWVMSPLVVSQVLPNDRPYFDVVIFDEASQVRPAEAIPAIARGRRLVVAGDEKQLPPTDFFSGPVITSDGDDDGLALAATSNDFESVLDVLEFLVEPRMLEWHYRSADERLIAFSNAHLYGKSLLTFPGVSGPECLRHVDVPWTPGQADGEDSSNAEVLKVVELVLEHAEERPQQTLGVIAMGIKHAERIDGALRNALRDRSDLDEFFDEDRPERFFVKNLERVQGDERDAIILTVGYTKSTDGRMRYAFGPLNEEGGERRLNVAVTRARRRMTAVASFTAADMDPERTKRGGDLLRLYLAYAESSGEKLDRQAAEAPELNAFELDIRDALEKAGVPLICQHGVGRYRLDFAAKHPTQPGRLVLAIEADGASYHSAETARDRDRLRQEQLERLGWRFHRIWSQDWFADREREIHKAVAVYQAALGASDDPPAAAPPSTVPAPPLPSVARGRDRGPRPNLYRWGKIEEFTDRDLQAMVRWIESDTLLRSREDLITEVMAELGFERRGKKIVARIGAAIDTVRAQSRR
jgi:very-short-patch-repair endonuclease